MPPSLIVWANCTIFQTVLFILQCNYGVRFDGRYGVDYMMKGLADEVERRMQSVGVRGMKITLKIMKRKEGAGNSAKFLGHGACHHLSKSSELGLVPTLDSVTIFQAGMKMLKELSVDKDDIRGMGIVISKLDNANSVEMTAGENKMSTWLNGFQNDDNVAAKSTQGIDTSNELITTAQVQAASPEEASLSQGEVKPIQGLSSTQSELPHQVLENSRLETSPFQEASSFISEQQKEVSGLREKNADNPEAAERRQPVKRRLQMCEDERNKLSKSGCCSGDKYIGFGSKLNAQSLCCNTGKEGTSETITAEDIDTVGKTAYAEGSDQSNTIFVHTSPQQLNDFEEDIVLPPLSQIDENAVKALPSPLRSQIMRKLRSKHGALHDQINLSLSPSEPAAEQKQGTPPGLKLKRRKTRGRKKDIADPGQLSVKRMLKLASVKSGQQVLKERPGGKTVSITQLECLPLNMQLQIANNDEVSLLLRSPVEKNGRNSSRSATPIQMRVSDKGPLAVDPVGVTEDLGNTYDFFHDNVLPLRSWLVSKPFPSLDEVEKIQDFFSSCIDEKRLDEVVKMLRIIKCGPGVWGGDPYHTILGAVNQYLVATGRLQLDTQWLGLDK